MKPLTVRRFWCLTQEEGEEPRTSERDNCGDPLPSVPSQKTQHYNAGLLRCGTPTWWRGIRETICRSRAQWNWLQTLPLYARNDE